MRKTLALAGVLNVVLGSGAANAANTGLYFNLNQTGAPLSEPIKVVLCLAPNFNCQNYTVTNENFSISSTPKNHVYKMSTVEVKTPGVSLPSFGGLACSTGTKCTFESSDSTSSVVPTQKEGTSTYFLGGTIIGLPSSSSFSASNLVLQNNGSDNELVPLGSKSYVFNTRVSDGFK